ncbi:ThiF family adenylyltransferase [Siminovitchia sp. FSL W7-1587]|uniref:HesA/MoeB/ThiF family protein n=1 Tax=Siminovitchia sp. FSL W7-1587 TaxID=2954699 RepID=UPI0030D451E8
MKIYGIKESLEIYVEGEEFIHFLFVHNQKQLIYDYDPGFLSLLKVMEEKRSLKEIIYEVKLVNPEITENDITNAIKLLLEDGIVFEVSGKLTQIESYNRNQRQIDFFNEYDSSRGGEIIQKELSSKKAVIIGLGGIGSWVITTLAMAGINHFVILDGDIVEESNLTRQNLYTYNDIGRKKVDVVKHKIRMLNQEAQVDTFDMFCHQDTDIHSVVNGSDIVISCIDEPSVTETGKWVSRAAQDLKIPHIVSGGYLGHLGFIGPTIIPGETICWECIVESLESDYKDWKLIKSSRRVGSIGSLSSIVANLHAWEAIRVLTNISEPIMKNKRGEFDFIKLNIKLFDIERNKNCGICSHAQKLKKVR